MSNVKRDGINGITLLPCPFCGGEAKMSREVTCGYETFWAHCLGCRSQANFGHTEAEATEAWNTRYHSVFEETVIKAWKEIKDYQERTCRNSDEDESCGYFKCSLCKVECSVEYCGSGYDVPNYCPNCGAKVIA